MSLFPSESWMKQTLTERWVGPQRLTFEGPWRDIRRFVQTLIKDGWREVSIEPNAEFTLTTVVLEKEL